MTKFDHIPLIEAIQLKRGYDLPVGDRKLGEIPIIGSSGITGYHDQAKLTGPGVAIGRSGASIGVATFCNSPYWPLNTCLYVTDFKGNDPRWVYYVLDSIDFTGYNSGSAQPSLNRNYLAAIPFPLTHIDEQKRIAAALGALDDKIESNSNQIGIMSLLAEAVGQIESENLPLTELSNMAILKRKASPISSFSGKSVHHYSLPAYDNSESPVREMADDIKSNKIVLDGPSILVSRLNPRTKRTWWVNPSPDTVSLSSTEFAILSTSNGTDLTAVWLAVADNEFQERMRASVTGTSGSHQRVSPTTLMGLKVPDFRHASAESLQVVSTLLDRSDTLKNENQRLAALRDALLPELLSGRIRTTEIEDTVEEAIA